MHKRASECRYQILARYRTSRTPLRSNERPEGMPHHCRHCKRGTPKRGDPAEKCGAVLQDDATQGYCFQVAPNFRSFNQRHEPSRRHAPRDCRHGHGLRITASADRQRAIALHFDEFRDQRETDRQRVNCSIARNERLGLRRIPVADNLESWRHPAYRYIDLPGPPSNGHHQI